MGRPRTLLVAAALAAPLCLAQAPAAHDVADPGAPAGTTDPLPKGSVARVSPRLVSKSSYEHWYRAAVATEGKTSRTRGEVMEFLISRIWLEEEAPEHGQTATKDEITKSLEKQKRRVFGSEREYRAFLKRTKRTNGDIRLQVKLSILSRRLEAHARSAGKTAAERKEALRRFTKAFRRKWRARTVCHEKFTTGECSRSVPVAP
ncbi:MAG TPA: hypothetical protein VF520_06630 [Thermoleophilaceae bacterium]|jgi:hypothetical protein